MEERKNEGPIHYSSMAETSLRQIYCNKKKLLPDETNAESSGFHIFLQLTSIIAQGIQQEVRLVVGLHKEVKKPRSNLQAIQAVLLDAEERQVKERNVRLWLDRLKDTSYDIDDMLDEWNCTLLKQRIEGVENALVPNKRRNSNIMVQPC